MEKNLNIYKKAWKFISRVKNVLVISHRSPDADTLGAAISFKILLDKIGKKSTLACVDKPSKIFSFMPYINEFVDEFNIKDYDLVVIVDSGASYMTNFHLKYDNFFKSNVPILNIDHHASNDNFGNINIVDSKSASTTIILYKMFLSWGIDIDSDIATCLLAGIYGDTGSFMHSNTTKEVFDIACELMNKGAQIAQLGRSLFGKNSVATLRLWGKVLEKSYVTSDKVVMSVVRENDYEDVGADPADLSGVVDYLNMVPGSKFAVLINEDRRGNVKGSFRTQKDGVDLSRIAAVFGGGGHPKASGFSVPGRLREDVRYTIVTDDMSKKSLEF